jgi:hypothetical protein
MGKLRQQCGFTHPAQPGDDHRMGQLGSAFDFGQLLSLSTRIELPECLTLFQQCGFNLILRSPGFPIVFIHTEIIHPIVFIINENYRVQQVMLSSYSE